MGEPACLMAELDDEGRIIERPVRIVVSDRSEPLVDSAEAPAGREAGSD